MTRNESRILLASVLALGLACDLPPAPVGEDHDDDAAGDDGDDGPGMATTGGGDGPGMSSADDGDGGDGDPPGPDLGDDGGAGAACDPLVQDCPAGEGCYPDDGAFACSVPSPPPGQTGDTCVEDEDCDLGLFCAGICTYFCDLGHPTPCDDPSHVCEPWYERGAAPPGLETVGSCVDAPGPGGGGACDPITQDCPADEACYPGDEGFECSTIVTNGQEGDACNDDEECTIGLLCDIDAVCHAICHVTGASGLSCTSPGQTCDPYYARGAAPPGLEDVGVCRE